MINISTNTSTKVSILTNRYIHTHTGIAMTLILVKNSLNTNTDIGICLFPHTLAGTNTHSDANGKTDCNTIATNTNINSDTNPTMTTY